jgi:tryptophanase
MIEIDADEKVIHQPKLDTIKMVENFIREHSGEYKKRALWEHLPKKMMYQTYDVTIKYLMDSGKIAIDKDNKICWIWNPELIKRYMNDNDLRIR